LASPSKYRELVQRQLIPPRSSPTIDSEAELDALVKGLEERKREAAGSEGTLKADSIRALRDRMVHEFIPVFVELVEKYGKTGVSLQMDASSLLEGGREIRFDFALGDHRTQLLGTVTTEAIAFHETRFSPEVDGELVSGPMLRLRYLTKDTFRSFVCERLTLLLRAAMRRR